eukprot:scaffold62283_cov14-Tisochrysis_lutea.AAC.1
MRWPPNGSLPQGYDILPSSLANMVWVMETMISPIPNHAFLIKNKVFVSCPYFQLPLSTFLILHPTLLVQKHGQHPQPVPHFEWLETND